MVASTRQLLIAFNWIEREKKFHTISEKWNLAIKLNEPTFYFFYFHDWKLQTNTQKISSWLKLYPAVLCCTLETYHLYHFLCEIWNIHTHKKENLKGFCEDRRFATHNKEWTVKWLFSKMHFISKMYFTWMNAC